MARIYLQKKNKTPYCHNKQGAHATISDDSDAFMFTWTSVNSHQKRFYPHLIHFNSFSRAVFESPSVHITRGHRLETPALITCSPRFDNKNGFSHLTLNVSYTCKLLFDTFASIAQLFRCRLICHSLRINTCVRPYARRSTRVSSRLLHTRVFHPKTKIFIIFFFFLNDRQRPRLAWEWMRSPFTLPEVGGIDLLRMRKS